MRRIVTTLLVGLLLLLNACSPATRSNALAGSSWVLLELDGSPPLSDVPITIAFQGSTVSGRAGCNPFNGPYTIDNAGLRLSGVMQGAMLCTNDAIMAQETIFFDALRSTDTYRFPAERRLELRDQNGTVRLMFQALGR